MEICERTEASAECISQILEIGEEMLLCVLEKLSTRELCNLEQVCSAFRRPAVLSVGDERPSLPEAAAKGVVTRAEHLRPYARVGAEPWRKVLLMSEGGMMAPGVLYDVPMAAVQQSGWTLSYRQPYSHRTSDADLDSVPAHARYILVGAIHATGARFGQPGSGTGPPMRPTSLPSPNEIRCMCGRVMHPLS